MSEDAGRGALSSSPPTVSILMPVYNTARFLAEAIDSILSQTFTDFELIIIDDGSTDGSSRIAEQCSRRDPRIRCYSRENRGCYQTRIEAFSLSRGEFIAVMDSDDVSLPKRLAVEIEYLRQHPECVAVGGWMLTVDPEGMPLQEFRLPLTHEEIDAWHMEVSGGALVHGTMMFRREAYLAIGGYKGKHATSEDMDLILRLAEVGRLANIPQVLLKYRQHLGSMNISRREQQRQDSLDLVREACIRRGLPCQPARRSLPDPLSDPVNARHDWVRVALDSGHIATARKHAWHIVRNQPLSPCGWRLWSAAMLGRADRGPGKWIRTAKHALGTWLS